MNAHERPVGKLVFKTLGPYQVLKTDERRLSIESDDGIRTINANESMRAPETPDGDPSWARALKEWQVPALPSTSNKPLEALFDKFVGHWDDESGRLILRARWFCYGSNADTWEYVEGLPTKKVHRYCQGANLQVRRRGFPVP